MGASSQRKHARRAVRDAFGVDLLKRFESHATSIADVIRALHHETHMRVQHVEMVQQDLNAHKGIIRDLQAQLAELKAAR